MKEQIIRRVVREELLRKEAARGENVNLRPTSIYDFYEEDPVVGQKAEEWLDTKRAFMMSSDMVPYSVVEYLKNNSERVKSLRQTDMSSEYTVEVNVMGEEFPAIEYKSGGVSFYLFPPEAVTNVRNLISQ